MRHDHDTDADELTGPGHAVPKDPIDYLGELVRRLETAVAHAETLFQHGSALTQRVTTVEARLAALENKAAE